MPFGGAHHFGIDTFNSTVNNITRIRHYQYSPSDSPSSILHAARAIEATQTSKTASYAPKCKPGTRTKVIGDIMERIRAAEKPVLWFSGPAGGGKTCIMREVADRCQREGWATFTYFFSTRIAGLDTANPFVATIVHQLIGAIPALQPAVMALISRYPTIFQESLDFQLEKLIVEPLGSSHFHSVASSPLKVVLVIDGFDECRDITERQHLLHLLGSLNARLSHPFFVVLASRPELDLRLAFGSSQLFSVTQVLRLQDYDGKDDVRIFYCDEFEKIRANHPMKWLIPESWPIEQVLHLLIDKSSGHFILPSTIIKYINNPRRNPVELLKKALDTPLTSSDNPLSELDAIYTLILHPPDTNIPLMKRLLHCVLTMGLVFHRATPAFFEQFLLLSPGAVESTLCDLHSILSVPSPDSNENESITFHHRSLEDYLLSPTRSLDFFQSSYDTHLDFALACTHHLRTWAENPRVIAVDDLATGYASSHWTFHLHLYLGLHHRETGSSATVPDSILQFDPRILWRCHFVLHGNIKKWELYVQEIDHQHEASHLRSGTPVCTDRSCLPFFERVHRMEGSYQKAKFFAGPMMPWTAEERLRALPRFDSETGLYGECEFDELSYPAGYRLLDHGIFVA